MAERYVLVVEDNPDDALMYRHVIELLMHHHATHAGDGITALQLAKEYHYDLVMLDANLPNLQGWDIAASLRQMEQYKETPIIAITAFDQVQDRLRMLLAGCDLYLIKPVSIDGLVTAISQFLGISGQREM